MSDEEARPDKAKRGPDEPRPRIGFMEGRLKVPPDFKEMGREKIVALFEGDNRNGDSEGSGPK